MSTAARGTGAAHPRKFFWRYKAGSQRAVRDGDFKYLRIAGNEFLFDVAQDPRERGNRVEKRRGKRAERVRQQGIAREPQHEPRRIRGRAEFHHHEGQGEDDPGQRDHAGRD